MSHPEEELLGARLKISWKWLREGVGGPGGGLKVANLGKAPLGREWILVRHVQHPLEAAAAELQGLRAWEETLL